MNLLKILLVEDNPADARLVKESFNHFKIENEIYTIRDGFEAIKFLKNEAEYLDAPKPDIILLDLNLPKKDGREVLKEIKRSHQFKSGCLLGYPPIAYSFLTTCSSVCWISLS
jgi:CheY-like chemotaxis protein